MILCGDDCVAESEGFEPPIPFRVCRFSRPVPSTTRPTLRLKAVRSSAACRQADDATHISLHASPIASRDWPLERRFALRLSQRCGGSSGIARWEPYSYMRFERLHSHQPSLARDTHRHKALERQSSGISSRSFYYCLNLAAMLRACRLRMHGFNKNVTVL